MIYHDVLREAPVALSCELALYYLTRDHRVFDAEMSFLFGYESGLRDLRKRKAAALHVLREALGNAEWEATYDRDTA